MTTGYPQPRLEVALLDLGRHGSRWYLLINAPADDVEMAVEAAAFGARSEMIKRYVQGGPYATEADAQAEVERRYAEMQAEYEWVEEQARIGGYRVAW